MVGIAHVVLCWARSGCSQSVPVELVELVELHRVTTELAETTRNSPVYTGGNLRNALRRLMHRADLEHGAEREIFRVGLGRSDGIHRA